MSELDRQRGSVVEAAKTWLGTKFLMNAAVRGAGVDCARLCLMSYLAAGLDMPAVRTFPQLSPDWNLHANEERLLGLLEAHLEYVEQPKPGDMAVFRIGGRVFAHTAIVVAWPQVIHVLMRRTCEYADATKAPLAGHAFRFMTPREWISARADYATNLVAK